MNIEERILDNTLRDATRIVSQKPHDSEGKDGDFAVGNTIDGTKLFAKVKNKWHAFSTRRPEEEEKVTSFGRELLPDQGIYILYGGMSGNGIDPVTTTESDIQNHILPLGGGYSSDVPDHWAGTNDASVGGFFKTTFIAPFDAVIKDVFIRATAPINNNSPHYPLFAGMIAAGPGDNFFADDCIHNPEMGWSAQSHPNHNDTNTTYRLTTDFHDDTWFGSHFFIPHDSLVMIVVHMHGLSDTQPAETSTKLNYSIPLHMYRPGGPRR